MIGKDILIEIDQKEYPARVTSIDDKCRLVIDYENGHSFHLEPGKGSIRKIL